MAGVFLYMKFSICTSIEETLLSYYVAATGLQKGFLFMKFPSSDSILVNTVVFIVHLNRMKSSLHTNQKTI